MSRPIFLLLPSLILTNLLSSAAIEQQDPTALSQPMTIKWRYSSDQISNFTPAADGRVIYLPLAGGILLALNAADGRLLWRAEIGGEFSAPPTIDEHNLYVATEHGDSQNKIVRGTVQALSKETGITIWMKTLPSALRSGIASGSSAIFAAARNGIVYGFEKRSGLILWIHQHNEAFDEQPVVSGNHVYLGSSNGTLLAFDQSTGRIVWHYRAHAAIKSVAIANDIAYFGSSDGYVYALREHRSKLIWKRRTGASVQSVTIVDNGLLASSLDNFAYLLSLNKGALVWRRLLPGRTPARPLIGPDGALFTPLSADSAIVLSLKDGKPVNALTIGEENTNSAGPISAHNLVLLVTPHALLAFGPL